MVPPEGVEVGLLGDGLLGNSLLVDGLLGGGLLGDGFGDFCFPLPLLDEAALLTSSSLVRDHLE